MFVFNVFSFGWVFFLFSIHYVWVGSISMDASAWIIV